MGYVSFREGIFFGRILGFLPQVGNFKNFMNGFDSFSMFEASSKVLPCLQGKRWNETQNSGRPV